MVFHPEVAMGIARNQRRLVDEQDTADGVEDPADLGPLLSMYWPTYDRLASTR